MQEVLQHLGKREYRMVKPDIMMISTEKEGTITKREQTLISVVILHPRSIQGYKLFGKAVKQNQYVTIEQRNRLEYEKHDRKHWGLPKSLSWSTLTVKVKIKGEKKISKRKMKKTIEEIRKERNKAISILKSGVGIEILEKGKLIEVVLEAKARGEWVHEVIYDIGNFEEILCLESIPKREIPIFPQQQKKIKIPIGTNMLNPYRVAGLKEIPKMFVIAGSKKEVVIGTLQAIIQKIIVQKKRIIILDWNNELNGLKTALRQNGSWDKILTEYQLGVNLEINLCKIGLPGKIKGEEDELVMTSEILANLIAYASQNQTICLNLSQLRIKIHKALEQLPEEERTLDKIVKTESFTDLISTMDQNTNERLMAEIENFSNYKELNAKENTPEFETQLDENTGIMLVQFPYQSNKVKRFVAGCLLQKIAQKCNSKTILVITKAEEIFGEVQENFLKELYKETLEQYYEEIINSSSIVITTSRPSQLTTGVKKELESGLFFKLNDEREREWLKQHFNLEKYLKKEEEKAFLNDMHDEGLLIEAGDPTSIGLVVPQKREPVILTV
ncbi:MAG: hypothetical protein ACTSR2_06505 [Candidatus Hodarchaeales archaeon]